MDELMHRACLARNAIFSYPSSLISLSPSSVPFFLCECFEALKTSNTQDLSWMHSWTSMFSLTHWEIKIGTLKCIVFQ